MTAESFIFREAVAADLPALAQLHVDAFIETHGGPGPAYQVREWQWRQAFAEADPAWFCYVIAAANGSLVGFAKGVPYTEAIPDYAGELNKIYLLREYHRRGLGRLLIGYVSRRFLSQGIDSMLLFGDAANPSSGFYEALGAERIITPAGEFHGGYGWRDLRALEKRGFPNEFL